MLIILKKEVTDKELANICSFLRSLTGDFSIHRDDERLTVVLSRALDSVTKEKMSALPGVEKLIDESAERSLNHNDHSIKIKDRTISRNNFTVIAGPCTIDSKDDLRQTAKDLQSLEIHFLRGGAYKLRSSPYTYQGLGREALLYMQEISAEFDLISVSEIISIEDLETMQEYVDILIVGTRNMQNYRLLSALGEISKPVILKRGMANTINEWILAAEYIAKGGNTNIILCERGIRTFENFTRNTLDISAVPAIKNMTPYPVFVDPSHSSGKRELVKPLAWAAAAAGADGLLIECHHDPAKARCDARQTITIANLREIIKHLPEITKLWNKA